MSREPQGHFLGLPYNWSRPSRDDVKRTVWDPDDDRIFHPHTVGWGYGVNFAALRRKITGR